ncbi:hypothetical protein GJ744_000783 [Endocarpon pusillum]|uniref:Uncharacterized protein n=1 Tax=Endocarpon pusillum TaxID=364733 RepID=A0A8H7AE48_9EURO|nr:hypothetical protein GJ744_000783 [Endocarpon pusillum]
MVRPSTALSARLRLTTKQVNGGYYKGNRTGSMGAHTEWGGYVIDYRKARNYNCPDLKDSRLTPFVSAQIDPRNLDRAARDDTTYIPGRSSGRAFIEAWKNDSPDEYSTKLDKWMLYFAQAEKIAAQQSIEHSAEALEPEEADKTMESIGLEDHYHIDTQGDKDTTAEAEDVPGESGRLWRKGITGQRKISSNPAPPQQETDQRRQPY